ADLAHFLVRLLEQITMTAQMNLAAGVEAGRIWDQPHDRERSYALSRARFTNNAEHFVGIDFEGNAIDRLGGSPFDAEVGLQLPHDQERFLGSVSRLRRGLLRWLRRFGNFRE